MDYHILQQVIADQKIMLSKRSRGTDRLINSEKHLKSEQISIISGIRRSGKSTLLLQMSDKIPRLSLYHI